MNTNAVIRDALKEIVLNGENFLNIPHLYYAEVTEVDEPTRTCTVKLLNGRAELEVTDVQLMASVADGLFQVPEIGSTVLVNNTPNMQPSVVMYSQLSKVSSIVNGIEITVDNTNVFIEAGSSKVNFSDGLIKFNDGSNKGLVKVIELTQRLNAIENLLNNLQDKFNAWSPAAGDGGAALKAILTVTPPIWNVPHIPNTTRSDIEDTAITH